MKNQKKMKEKINQNPKVVGNYNVGPVSITRKNDKKDLPQRITWDDVVKAGIEWYQEHLKEQAEKGDSGNNQGGSK